MAAVAVVGVGAMGSVMVERFRAAGLPVNVFDASPAALDRAAALGAVPARSAAETGQDAAFASVMVRDDQQVLDCVLGAEGLLAGLRPGAVILLHSTIHPDTTIAVATAAQARGVQVADACITGIPPVFRAGQAAAIVGASVELLERIRPHLLLLVSRIFHMGPLGSGNVAKALKNYVLVSREMMLREAQAIGLARGLDGAGLAELIGFAGAMDGGGPLSSAALGRNLFGSVLPIAARLSEEEHVEAPITRRLAAGGNPYQK